VSKHVFSPEVVTAHRFSKRKSRSCAQGRELMFFVVRSIGGIFEEQQIFNENPTVVVS
jgi:hypothetical protein